MFNQQKYINEYIKSNYKSFKIRIKVNDIILLTKINNTNNINNYVLDLIRKDIEQNRKYNFINNNIVINFELSNILKNLVNKIEEADYINDYGLYMNYVYAIDAEAKKEVTNHLITEGDWNKLLRRYQL